VALRSPAQDEWRALQKTKREQIQQAMSDDDDFEEE